jgi:hypothetical protein
MLTEKVLNESVVVATVNSLGTTSPDEAGTIIIAKYSSAGDEKELLMIASGASIIFEVQLNGRSLITTDNLTTAVDSYNNHELISFKKAESKVEEPKTINELTPDAALQDVDQTIVLDVFTTPFKSKVLTMRLRGEAVSYQVTEDGEVVFATQNIAKAVTEYNKISENDTVARKILEDAILDYKTASNGPIDRQRDQARTNLFSLVGNNHDQ